MTPPSVNNFFRAEALRTLARELSGWSLLPLAIAIFAAWFPPTVTGSAG